MGGKLRMISGLTPLRVMSGPGSLSPLAEPDAVVVRLVYPDAPGREVWLDQMRPVELESGPVAAARRAPPGSLIPGDTLLSGDGAGRRSVRWLDGQGGRLALTGMLPGDSLRALARRVY